MRRFIEEQGTDPEVLVQLTRVTGQSLARIADAQVTDAVLRLQRLGKETTPDLARGELIARIHVLTAGFDQLMGYVLAPPRAGGRAAPAGHASAADRTLTIGFADLVGFTALSQALEPKELAAMVDRFEAIAYEHIVERGGPGREDDRRRGDVRASRTMSRQRKSRLALVDALARDDTPARCPRRARLAGRRWPGRATCSARP